MSRPPRLPWFNHPNNIRWRIHNSFNTNTSSSESYKNDLWSSSLCNFLHDLSSSLFGPNILLNTLFSKTPSLC
jgi:hypothetical protein